MVNGEEDTSTNSIVNLRLDVAAARRGETWNLLPEGYRDPKPARLYPLVSSLNELTVLCEIPIPYRCADAGAVYLRRCRKELAKRAGRAPSALLDFGRRKRKVDAAQTAHNAYLKEKQREIEASVNAIKEDAAKAAASLKDLFALGRQGLEGQMKAHLEGVTWQEETIDGAAFRDCFRLVAQAVKGLGMPADERAQAREAVIAEAAASLRDTESALTFASGPPDEKPQ